MKDFSGKIAVISGAGTGMGRELARQLAAEGCSVAICDVVDERLAETRQACMDAAPPGTRITAHHCDVANEAQVLAFRDEVVAQHATPYINLLFNNAGISGGGSFLLDTREEWDRTFGVSWLGVYYCTRAFMPLLVASTDGYVVNTSSVNGFWACLGPGTPHTAYCAAKFAIKGFTEALVTDLRVNAPHVKAAVVMPGHIGTSIALNSRLLHGKSSAADMSVDEVAGYRARLARQGVPTDRVTDEMLKSGMQQGLEDFRDNAPLTAAQAATIILDGVRTDKWRILVGDDAHVLDRLVRESPDEAYEQSFAARLRAQTEAGIIHTVR